MSDPGEQTDRGGRGAQLAHWMASGEILPAQSPGRSAWTPEVRLAAAVLAATLEHIRIHHAKPHRRRAVQDDLEWVFSDDEAWPFAFTPLCQLLGVDPDFARTSVRRWLADSPPSARRAFYVHRRAA